MLSPSILAALVGLGGVLLGGGLTAAQAETSRVRERRALAAVLREDVACLLELIEARQILSGIEAYLAHLEAAVIVGRKDQLISRWRIPMTADYFSCYTANLPRVHLLAREDAAAFTRFYRFAQVATEVMMIRAPAEPAVVTIEQAARVVRTEQAMIRRAVALGQEIVGVGSRGLPPIPDLGIGGEPPEITPARRNASGCP